MKMNDKRASRTRNFPGADTFVYVEGNSEESDMASSPNPGGVCVVGMYENVCQRNLGGPESSFTGKRERNRLEALSDGSGSQTDS